MSYDRSEYKCFERKKGTILNELPSEYVIIDLETTDFNIYYCEIIEMSAIKIKDGEIVDSFDSFVKPHHPIPKKITNLTGISDLTVYKSPDIEEVLPKYIEFIGNNIVAGYNVQRFDTNIIYDEYHKLFGKHFNNDYADFIYDFKTMLNNQGVTLPNYKETTIAQYFGIDTSKAHNSLEDCKICFEIYKNLISHKKGDSSLIQSDDEEDEEIGKEIGRNIADNPVEQGIIDMINRLIKEYKLPEDSLYLSINERKPDPKTGKPKLPTKTIAIHEPAYPPMAYDVQGFNVRITTIEPKIYVKQDNMLWFHVRPTKYENTPYTGDPEQIAIRGKKKSPESEEFEEIYEYIIKTKPDDLSILVWIEKITRYAIEHYVSSNIFGCCSKQAECKEAGECLHINRLYATGCMYRKFVEKK